MTRENPRILADLKAKVGQIETFGRPQRAVLPFGVPDLDCALPGGGLPQGVLHEVIGGGAGAVHGAAAALFCAGILARTDGPVLWCIKYRDLFAPALAQVGLHPDRVVYCETGSEDLVLFSVEEGLRNGGLAGVVGECSKLTMTASRRLQLAAESTGTTAFVIRRFRTVAAADDFIQPSAAATRWRITSLPSAALPVRGIGRARWLVELVRTRGGESREWILEACDDQGHLRLPSVMADGPAVSDGRRQSAASG